MGNIYLWSLGTSCELPHIRLEMLLNIWYRSVNQSINQCCFLVFSLGEIYWGSTFLSLILKWASQGTLYVERIDKIIGKTPSWVDSLWISEGGGPQSRFSPDLNLWAGIYGLLPWFLKIIKMFIWAGIWHYLKKYSNTPNLSCCLLGEQTTWNGTIVANFSEQED